MREGWAQHGVEAVGGIEAPQAGRRQGTAGVPLVAAPLPLPVPATASRRRRDCPRSSLSTGGVIEVAMSTYGIRRCHYRPLGGQPRQLTPDPASAEGLRARFGASHPGHSRAIGIGMERALRARCSSLLDAAGH
jgi:hypothetical protein